MKTWIWILVLVAVAIIVFFVAKKMTAKPCPCESKNIEIKPVVSEPAGPTVPTTGIQPSSPVNPAGKDRVSEVIGA